MMIDGKTLYARIVDTTGLAEGLQGYAFDFCLAADQQDLAEMVGSDGVDFYVEAPNAQCAGWRYENGVWIEPA